MSKKHIFSTRKQQHKKVEKFKSKGYTVITNQHNGVMLGIVDGEGFKQRVVISKHGEVRRYKPVRASTYDVQSLPHTSRKLVNIVQ